MGCRSGFFCVYFGLVGVIFFGFAAYSALLYITGGRDCNVACATSIISPSFECAAGTSISDMYSSRCFECATGSTVMQWGCPSSVPLPACGQDAKLASTGCKSQLLESDVLKAYFGETAEANCVEYLATDILAQPNSLRTTTLADKSTGPGIVLVTSTVEAGAAAKDGTCLNTTLARDNLVMEGALCFTVPLGISFRSLLQPTMAAYAGGFLMEAIGVLVLAMVLSFFRGVRSEWMVRPRGVLAVAGCCVRCTPIFVRLCNVMTAVMLVITTFLIYSLETCREARNPEGQFQFFAGASMLLMASNFAFWLLCFGGGFVRNTLHPEAGLALPRAAADDAPLQCKMDKCECMRKVCRCIGRTAYKLGPA